MIETTGIESTGRILDVGGGASTLVDDLLARRFERVTVLDLTPAALRMARARLGDAATRAGWVVADARNMPFLHRAFDLWHDRAVLHFLTRAEDRSQYVAALRTVLAPGGTVVLATFGPEGPRQCSGLPVRRYGIDRLRRLLGDDFRLLHWHLEPHVTPGGTEQQFLYAMLAYGPAPLPRGRD